MVGGEPKVTKARSGFNRETEVKVQNVSLLTSSDSFGSSVDKPAMTLLPEAGCGLWAYVDGIYCIC